MDQSVAFLCRERLADFVTEVALKDSKYLLHDVNIVENNVFPHAIIVVSLATSVSIFKVACNGLCFTILSN